MDEAADVPNGHPVLIDRFLEDAFELDVDLICDGQRAVVGGHPAAHRGGRHPLRRFGGGASRLIGSTQADLDVMRDIAAPAGPAARGGRADERPVRDRRTAGSTCWRSIPRASRTVPFIAKAVGVPLVKIAVQVMAGQQAWRSIGFTEEPGVPGSSSRRRSSRSAASRGRSGARAGDEVDRRGDGGGHSASARAFAKAWMGAGHKLPTGGRAFLSVHDRDKKALVPVAKKLVRAGFLAGGHRRHGDLPGGPRPPGGEGARRSTRGTASWST